MTQITLISKLDGNTEYTADFEAVRTVRQYTIGWASVETEDSHLRFPAIITPWEGHTVTSSDWQTVFDVVFPGLDLADPKQVHELIATGSGAFFNPRTNRPSGLAQHFCE